GQGARGRGGQDQESSCGGRRRSRADRGTARRAGCQVSDDAGGANPEPERQYRDESRDTRLGSGPSPVDLAEMALVEAELDRRWPETKIEPSLTRIATLMDLLGSPQQAYPAIHIAGTNGKTSVTRMIDALLTALHRRTGRITSPHLQLATERISIDNAPI